MCETATSTHRKLLSRHIGQDNWAGVAATEAAIGLWSSGLPNQVVVWHKAPHPQDMLKEFVQKGSSHADNQDDAESKEEADSIQGAVASVVGLLPQLLTSPLTPSAPPPPHLLLVSIAKLLPLDVPIATGDFVQSLDFGQEQTGTVVVVLVAVAHCCCCCYGSFIEAQVCFVFILLRHREVRTGLTLNTPLLALLVDLIFYTFGIYTRLSDQRMTALHIS